MEASQARLYSWSVGDSCLCYYYPILLPSSSQITTCAIQIHIHSITRDHAAVDTHNWIMLGCRCVLGIRKYVICIISYVLELMALVVVLFGEILYRIHMSLFLGSFKGLKHQIR